jgi:hypothetical protein
MIRVTMTQIRPNTNVPFWYDTADGIAYGNYKLQNYGSRITNPSSSLSQDKLTATLSSDITSREHYDAFMVDPIVQSYLAKFASYNNANGIFAGERQITTI